MEAEAEGVAAVPATDSTDGVCVEDKPVARGGGEALVKREASGDGDGKAAPAVVPETGVATTGDGEGRGLPLLPASSDESAGGGGRCERTTSQPTRPATNSIKIVVVVRRGFIDENLSDVHPMCNGARPDRIDYRKPRYGEANRPRFGKTVGMCVLSTPNHFAIVAAYWSTAVVGIHRPVLVSSGPPTVNVGHVPYVR